MLFTALGIGATLVHHLAGRVIDRPGNLLGLVVGHDGQADVVLCRESIAEGERVVGCLLLRPIQVRYPDVHLVVLPVAHLEVGEERSGNGVDGQGTKRAAPGRLLYLSVDTHVENGTGERGTAYVA